MKCDSNDLKLNSDKTSALETLEIVKVGTVYGEIEH